jgi:hypothetical protein
MDNLSSILAVLSDESDSIWGYLSSSLPDMRRLSFEWSLVKLKLYEREKYFHEVPHGSTLRELAMRHGAKRRVLTGQHEEVAALINNRANTTLDVGKAYAWGKPTFTYDRWYYRETLRRMSWSEASIREADVLTLGLFAATEIVLVERRGKPRLPLLVIED